MDYPLSSRLDETDAMVIFDNVLIPWERVFIYRDAEMCNGLYNRTGAMPQIMHQFSHQEFGEGRVHDGGGVRDGALDQGRCASACSGHAGRTHPIYRVRARLPARQRGRCSAERAGLHDAGRDAAMDHPDDVPEDVHPDVRDHPDPRRRRAGRGAVLSPNFRVRSARTSKPISRRPMPTRAIASSCSVSHSTPRCRRSRAASSSTSAIIPATRCGLPGRCTNLRQGRLRGSDQRACSTISNRVRPATGRRSDSSQCSPPRSRRHFFERSRWRSRTPAFPLEQPG